MRESYPLFACMLSVPSPPSSSLLHVPLCRWPNWVARPCRAAVTHLSSALVRSSASYGEDSQWGQALDIG